MDATVRERVTAYVLEHGPDKACEVFGGLSKPALGWAAAGWPIADRTYEAIMRGLRDLDTGYARLSKTDKVAMRAKELIRGGVEQTEAYSRAMREYGIK